MNTAQIENVRQNGGSGLFWNQDTKSYVRIHQGFVKDLKPIESDTTEIKGWRGVAIKALTGLVRRLKLGAKRQPQTPTSPNLAWLSSLGVRGITATQVILSLLASAKLSENSAMVLATGSAFLVVAAIVAAIAIMHISNRSFAKREVVPKPQSLYTALVSLTSWLRETPMPK